MPKNPSKDDVGHVTLWGKTNKNSDMTNLHRHGREASQTRLRRHWVCYITQATTRQDNSKVATRRYVVWCRDVSLTYGGVSANFLDWCHTSYSLKTKQAFPFTASSTIQESFFLCSLRPFSTSSLQISESRHQTISRQWDEWDQTCYGESSPVMSHGSLSTICRPNAKAFIGRVQHHQDQKKHSTPSPKY